MQRQGFLIACHSNYLVETKLDPGLPDGRCQPRGCRYPDRRAVCRAYLTTRAPPPPMIFSTSLTEAMLVSPGVVMARAPWAAP